MYTKCPVNKLMKHYQLFYILVVQITLHCLNIATWYTPTMPTLLISAG